jgi:excisionase family DNA binding protein
MKKIQPIRAGVIAPADILTPDELAARLKVRKTWVYEKLRPGRKNPLPVFRIGKYLRFSWPAVSAWLDSTREAK